jgi:hypothetical protein
MNTHDQHLPATSILALFETTKAQRKSFADQVVESMKEGQANPLNVHLQVKATEELIKLLKETPEYMELVMEEARKYGSKSFEYRGAEMRIGDVGVKYDYSKCNDPVIADLHRQKKDIEAACKEREKFLQGLPSAGMEVLDESTGEMIRAYPPAKSGKESVVTALK